MGSELRLMNSSFKDQPTCSFDEVREIDLGTDGGKENLELNTQRLWFCLEDGGKKS